jgi:hypothetical protein
MPTATLTFQLPKERPEYEDAVNGGKYAVAIDAVREAFRARDKYAPDPSTTWAEARQLLLDTLSDSLGEDDHLRSALAEAAHEASELRARVVLAREALGKMLELTNRLSLFRSDLDVVREAREALKSLQAGEAGE